MKRVPIRIVLSLFLLICSIMLCLGSSSFAETCIQPPSGMIGWWTGDGNTNDRVGLNNGILQGGATFASGKVDTAFQLDGIDDYVNIPDSLNLNFGVNDFTVDFWVKFNTISGEQVMIEKYVEGTPRTGWTLTKLSNNIIRVHLADIYPQWTLNVLDVTPPSIPVDTWIFVALKRSGDTFTIYWNGIPIGSTTFPYTINLSTPATFKMGHRGNPQDTPGSLDGRGFYLNGFMDEVEIFNRALTAEEIKSIYNAGSAGKCKQSSCVQPPSGMIGWWTGDGNANDIIDSHNGTIIGNVTFTDGKVGPAFSIKDGGSFVEVQSSESLEPQVVSVDAWVKHLGSPGEFKYIISKGAVDCYCASYALYSGPGGGLFFYVCNGHHFVLSPDAGLGVWDGNWHHVVGTFDGNTVRLYIDGKEVEAGTPASMSIGYDLPTNDRFYIGSFGGSCSLSFNGDIDEVEIFNRALTAEEIKSIYNAGSAGKCKPSLVNVRLIDTIPMQDVEFVLSSATKTPYSVTQLADKTIVEWRYPNFDIGQSETISFDLELYRLIPGENRLVDHKLEVIYIDLNGKEVRYELPPLYVDVLSSAFLGVITTDKSVYDSNEDVIVSATVKSLSEYTRTIDAKILIEDAQGVLVKEITTLSNLNFAAGEEKTLGNIIFNTSGTFTGSYRAHLFLYDQQKLVGEATANFTIQPALTITNKVAVDKLSYSANEPVAITSTITSLSPNYIFQNVTAKVSVVNNAGQVLFTEDKPIQTLVPGQLIELKTYWNTSTNPSGTYTVALEVIEGATTLSTSQTTFEIIGSSNIGSGLVGTITAAPNPIYQGNTETLTYNVTNKGNEAISVLNTKIIIVDPDTKEVKIEFTSQGSINISETIAGIQTASTAILPAKIYLAILQASTTTMPSPLTLASATFEVKPALEATKKIPDITNLLVWINDGCHHHEKHDQCDGWDDKHKGNHDKCEHNNCDNKDCGNKHNDCNDNKNNDCDHNDKEHDDKDKDNECKDKHNNCDDNKCSHHKKCIRQDLLENILKETVTSYLIVKDKKDLEKELRNPYYTDIIILGEHHPIEDHYINELKEQIYSGKGIIASLYLKHGWYHDNECSHDQKHDNLFGIKYKGQLSGDNHQIELLNSSISEPDVLDAKGKANKTEANNINNIIAWIEESHHHSHKNPNKYPAIVLNTYGLGKTIYYAFDLGKTLDETNYTKLAAIIKNSITYIHKPQTQTTYQTNQLIPVEIQVKSLGSAFNLKLTETYSQEIKIYDPLTGNWITNNPWEITQTLPANETKTTLYYALMPNTIGTYTLKTDISYLENNTYNLYQTLSLDINVDKNNQILTSDIITALNALTVSHHDKHKLRKAIEQIEKVQKRTIKHKHDIEQNIHDILTAIDSLISITSTDTSNTRLMMDNLLIMWENKWFWM